MKRTTKLQRARMAREDAAFALMGAAFVRLLRGVSPVCADEVRPKAIEVADWVHLYMLTKDEANEFMVTTGWVFDSDLLPDPNFKEPLDYPRPALDEEIPF